MPEHDTFDLDAAFARLEQDIAGISAPRGAGAAIATARRRRQSRWAVAALAVVVVAGSAVGLHGHGGSDVQPARRPLPAPATLDPASLTAATAGWTPPWHTPSKRTVESSISNRTLGWSCHVSNDEGGSSSINGSSGLFQTDDGHFVQFGALRYHHNGAQAHQSQLRDALVACPGAQATDLAYSDGSKVSFIQLPALAGGTTEIGLVTQGHDLLELAIGPAAGITPEVRAHLADAMVAALQADSSASGVPESGPKTASEQFWVEFGSAQLEPALAGWASGWHAGPAPQGIRKEPCGSVAWSHAGIETNIGTDGFVWDHQFRSPSAAGDGYQRIENALTGCANTTTSTVTTSEGTTVLVARGDRDLWMVKHGDYVMVTYLPRAKTPAPDDVSRALGSAMVRAIDDGVAAYRNRNGG